MPELPEVETVRRQLEPLLLGKRLVEVTIDDARLTRPEPPEAIAGLLRGREVRTVGRRGKYLLFQLDEELSWLVHLRMTGSFAVGEADRGSGNQAPQGDGADLHRRATVVLDDGRVISYRDVRRFGTWALLENDDREAYLEARLGPEPLDESFDGAWLGERLAGSQASIKSALLDQRAVAGVGNIYADEALWRARIHPTSHGGALDSDTVDTLVEAVRAVLERGIERQGATLRDYSAPNGAAGRMQDEFAVYGREGEPCSRCGAPIAKLQLAGRGTWFCPDCQPRPRARRRTSSRPRKTAPRA